MGDGDRLPTGRSARALAALAAAGALGLVGVAAAPGSWTADEPRVNGPQPIAVASPITAAPTLTPPNGASNIDEFGPTCDRVADRIRQTNNGEMPFGGRQEVTACLIGRLVAKAPTNSRWVGGRWETILLGSGPAPDVADLAGIATGRDERRIVIVSDGPLPSSVLLRMGPIPAGFSVEQRTSGIPDARRDARERQLTRELSAVGSGSTAVAATVALSIDGRFADITVTAPNLPCTDDPATSTPSPASVTRVRALAEQRLLGVSINIDASPCPVIVATSA
jgi:hypothetical protein